MSDKTGDIGCLCPGSPAYCDEAPIYDIGARENFTVTFDFNRLSNEGDGASFWPARHAIAYDLSGVRAFDFADTMRTIFRYIPVNLS